MSTAKSAWLKQQLAGDFAPWWWDQHGWKMRLTDRTADSLTISGPAATVTLLRPAEAKYWKVTWRMEVFGTAGFVSGCNPFGLEELQAAFRLGDEVTLLTSGSEFLRSELDAEVVCAGKFVRTGRFLTLPYANPWPGTPDLNISICAESDIRDAVAEFIKATA